MDGVITASKSSYGMDLQVRSGIKDLKAAGLALQCSPKTSNYFVLVSDIFEVVSSKLRAKDEEANVYF